MSHAYGKMSLGSSGITELRKQREENVFKAPNTFLISTMYSGNGSFYSLFIHSTPLPAPQVTPTPAAPTAQLTHTEQG